MDAYTSLHTYTIINSETLPVYYVSFFSLPAHGRGGARATIKQPRFLKNFVRPPSRQAKRKGVRPQPVEDSLKSCFLLGRSTGNEEAGGAKPRLLKNCHLRRQIKNLSARGQKISSPKIPSFFARSPSLSVKITNQFPV